MRSAVFIMHGILYRGEVGQPAVCKGQQPVMHSCGHYVWLDPAPLLVGWLIFVATYNIACLWLLAISRCLGAVSGAVSSADLGAVSGAVSGAVFGDLSDVILVSRVLYQVPSRVLGVISGTVSGTVSGGKLYRVLSWALN